ncbi:MAG: SpoIID/LytB domain-containing protein, partial [Thermodesulfobacteriota bacterium]|nr:SpoIID/LytB domain-containing protein [Thermodesulfobacteriota bacterium]
HEKNGGSGQILAVNQLPLDKYLLGVVPKEMSPSWDQEALRSQAVAARSYAYFLLLKSTDKPYDVSATTASQVYGGADVGNKATAGAVAATRGRVLFYGGKPALAYFHAHSGGVLEDDKQVWTADLPYFEVKDDAVSQKFKPVDWECSIPAGSVADALQRSGFSGGRVTGLSIDTVSDSGRMATVRVDAGENPIVLKSNALRIMLGPTKMRSTLCTVKKKGDVFYFKGKGYGHGVGLSQWGAQAMAVQGKICPEILAHYYPGTELKKIY